MMAVVFNSESRRIAFVIQATFVTPRIPYLRQCMTMGDVMGTLDGINRKIITVLLGFLTAIFVTGTDLTVMGLLCEVLHNIPPVLSGRSGGYSSWLIEGDLLFQKRYLVFDV